MSTRDDYIKKIKDQIDDWNTDITEVEGKARQASAEIKTQYAQSLEALRAERDAAHQKIEEIIEASDDAWDEIRESAEDFWERSKAAYAAAKAEFKD